MSNIINMKNTFLLLGYGISNQSVRNYFEKNNIKYYIYDDYNLKYKEHLDFNSFQVIVKSPVIKDDHWVIKIAKNLNIEVVTDIELFYRFSILINPNRKIICLTGTNGKTTTVNLIKAIIQDIDLAGNLGIPLFDYVDSNKDIVIEASSYMLDYVKEFHANFNIFTNINQNHLDHHGSYSDYINAKLKMISNIKTEDVLIYNFDDLNLRKKFDMIDCVKMVYSLKEKADVYLDNNDFYYHEQKLININNIKLLGKHNLENLAASLSLVVSYYESLNNCLISNIDNALLKQIQKRVDDFTSVEHRLEYVGDIGNIKIYNDSKSTNLYALTTALKSFINKKILLICGGENSNMDLSRLDNDLTNISLVLVNGNNREGFSNYFNAKHIRNISYDNLELLINDLDDKINESEVEIILFSPGSVSYDQFKNFEERGNYFKDRISNLLHFN